MRISPTLTSACLLLGMALAAHAGDHQLPGRVLRVIDGDSLVLEVRGALYQVELAGVDAPELNQPWGEEAARFLNTRLTGAFVVVDANAGGTAHRVEGDLVFENRNVALDLLFDGLAWSTVAADGGQGRPPHPYDEAERQAREARRGLWSDEAPVPPWAWRRHQPAP